MPRMSMVWYFPEDDDAPLVNRGLELFYQGAYDQAELSFSQALALRDSPYARWDRALTRLALGKYRESWADHAARHQLFDLTPEAGKRVLEKLPRWDGAEGKRVAVVHEMGYGDGLMMLRFIRKLQGKLGAQVSLVVPRPLRRLAGQLAPVTDGDEAECCCLMFDLLPLLGETGETIPVPPYLRADPMLREMWRDRIDRDTAMRVGIAWSSVTTSGDRYDIKRSLQLEQFMRLSHLRETECQVYSLQRHEQEQAEACSVNALDLKDFADVAAVTSLMDVVISIDTAALHVAGAIGHPNTWAMLPHLACWRWLNSNPWYPSINQCRQQKPGDWASAFEQLEMWQ